MRPSLEPYGMESVLYLVIFKGILAHECGHGSFSNNAILNDTLGYILHTTVLVPYFSWQHSHAVHHAKTNHLTDGESHVPN
jgi:omega-6 fatty acid desaturase (delta-12 desaturase)